jgi:type I restriction enzyme R subunit
LRLEYQSGYNICKFVNQLEIAGNEKRIPGGINNKAGSFFAPYEFFYAWRRVAGLAKEVDGINSMFTLVQGMLNQNRLRDIIRNFIYLPDS